MGTIQESPAPQTEESEPSPASNAEIKPTTNDVVATNPANESPAENSSGEVTSGGDNGPNNASPSPSPIDGGGETPPANALSLGTLASGGEPHNTPPADGSAETPAANVTSPEANVPSAESNSAPTPVASDPAGAKIAKPDPVPRISGIPGASRIARPCCVGQQKPAVPATPTKNYSDDTIRHLTDDFGKHRLTDVQEENEDDTLGPSVDNSSRRLGSMDAIWDTHAHRLSEAGLIRHADNSVLTEDTDSFIIGDRVWVGGNKPGQIAYIGETQFAPGEWAGIALDQPIGKNDGSVGGIRYFQCEAKRGVFSRLTRLTRVPLPGADDSYLSTSMYSVSSTPINNGVRRRVGSPLSPTGSTKSLRKSPPSPSLSTSNTSLSSVTHIIDFKVGDRVIVKSSQGSKVGTLRYMGTTDFAAGEWCGVELDDPRGKNDGSVEGKRYFDCRPQFGLFAPVTKVSKSPLKYKPGNCVIHSGAGLPPTGMRRTGSKESMTSMTSSLASANSNARRVRLGINSLTPQKLTPKTPVSAYPTRTALQDVLREKQLHIEQLLKERDLERAEVTRAAGQADEVEQKLNVLRSEYEHYRLECETKFHEYSALLSGLKVDRNSLLSQLDDEKRKNEDLQFKFEEAAITKGDIEVTNESNLHRIRELEEQLAQEQQKVEGLETDSAKLFEAEEALVKSREEIDSLKNELHHTVKKRATLEDETAASIAALQEQLQSTHEQLEQTRIESAKTIEELTSEISATAVNSQSIRSTFDQELVGYQSRLKESSDNCKKQEDEIAALKAELALTKQLLEEKTIALDKKIAESVEVENTLKTELERSKRELSDKIVNLESNADVVKVKDKEIRSLKTQLETSEVDLKAKSLDIERYQESMKEAELNYKAEIEELRTTLKQKIEEKEDHEKRYAIIVSQKDAKLEDANQTLSQNSIEIEKLRADLLEAKETIERTSSEVHDRHTRQIQAREAQLMAMAAEIQQKNEEITKCSIVTTKLEDDICTKNGIIEKLRLELESFKRRFESEQLSISRYNEQINALQLSVGDLQRKLVATEQQVVELTQQKQRLEVEMQTVISSTGDYSSKLQELNSVVVQKEQLLQSVRVEYTEKIQHYQRIEQELRLQLQKVAEDSQRVTVNYEEKLRAAVQAEALLRQQCETATVETTKVRDELMIKVTQLQRLLEQKDFLLKKSSGEHVENERYLKEQLARTTAELQKTIDTCQIKINELTAENINAKNAIAQKSELVIETEAKLKLFVAQSTQTQVEIRHTFDEQLKKVSFQLAEKNAQVEQLVSEINLLKRDCEGQNINIAAKDHSIAELSAELQNTRLLVTQLQNEKEQLRLQQIEASKQYAASSQQCNDLLNQIAILTEKAALADKLAQDLQLQKNVYIQLFQQLQITERQKLTLIARLEDAANKNGEADKCYYMLELAKNLQASNADEQTKKIVELQQIIQVNEQKMQDTENQLENQRVEILKLQDQLLKAQQSYVAPQPGLQKSSKGL